MSNRKERFRRKKLSFIEQWKLLIRATGFARPQRWFIGVILFLTIIVAAANALEPLVMKYIFDNLGTLSPTMKAVLLGLAELIALGLLREGASAIANFLSWRTRIKIQYGLQDSTLSKIHRLPHDAARKESVGALMTRLERSIQGFINAISEISFNLLPALAYLIIAIVIMFRLEWKLTLLLLCFVPLPAIITGFSANTQARREKTLLERWTKIYGRFNEVLSGIITVRSFAMEDAEKKRFMRDVHEANNIVVNGVAYDSKINAAQNFAILCARICAIGLGSYYVIHGQATLGTLLAFLTYINGLFGPVQGLTGIYRTIRTASVSLEQIFTILDTHDHLGDAPDAIDLIHFTGEVEFCDVHFSYHVSGNKILNGIDLHVRPGEMVAIVGPSGSGKSTLMALLMRFYDPTSGAIKIDGKNIKKLKQNSIRRQIGVVLQDALLFNESVKDNIAYGRPEASLEEIMSAAKSANAHQFIERLEHSYDTIAGERGCRFSVGERQRIAIARALLKDPPLLILDEATSALDAELEALVQEALENLIKGRTTFVIAHRLSTVIHADRILVLKNGNIIESGRHEELLELNGYYNTLVERQTRGLLVR